MTFSLSFPVMAPVLLSISLPLNELHYLSWAHLLCNWNVCAHLFLTAILLLQIWLCRFVLQLRYTSICHLSVRAVLRAVIDSLLLPSLFMTVKAQSSPYHYHTWTRAEWHDGINCLATKMLLPLIFSSVFLYPYSHFLLNWLLVLWYKLYR